MVVVLSLLAFGLVYGAANLGLALQRRLPEAHRQAPTKEAVQLVMGLIATMAALVLSLLIASAHTDFETQQAEVQKLARDVLLLDTALDHYGPEGQNLREVLRSDVILAVRSMSPEEGVGSVRVTADGLGSHKTHLYEQVLALDAKTNAQKFFQSKALELMSRIAEARLTMHEQATASSVPAALLIVMVLWLMLLFLGFGLYAPRNETVHVALGFGAFAVAGALFLILDMSHPYRGLIHVSDAPIHEGVRALGK